MLVMDILCSCSLASCSSLARSRSRFLARRARARSEARDTGGAAPAAAEEVEVSMVSVLAIRAGLTVFSRCDVWVCEEVARCGAGPGLEVGREVGLGREYVRGGGIGLAGGVWPYGEVYSTGRRSCGFVCG